MGQIIPSSVTVYISENPDRFKRSISLLKDTHREMKMNTDEAEDCLRENNSDKNVWLNIKAIDKSIVKTFDFFGLFYQTLSEEATTADKIKIIQLLQEQRKEQKKEDYMFYAMGGLFALFCVLSILESLGIIV